MNYINWTSYTVFFVLTVLFSYLIHSAYYKVGLGCALLVFIVALVYLGMGIWSCCD